MSIIEELFRDIENGDKESSKKLKKLWEGVVIWSRHYMGAKFGKYVDDIYKDVLLSLYRNRDKIDLDNLGEYYMDAIKYHCNIYKKKDKIWEYEKTFLLNDDKIVH